MSLKDAVLEIATDLSARADAADAGEDVATGSEWRVFAKQLRSACKASEESNPERIVRVQEEEASLFKLHGLDPNGPAKAQQKRLERAAEREDSTGIRMVELIDGSGDLCYEVHSVPADMPVGAKTLIDRRVFVLVRLDTGTLQLHYSPEETAKAFPQGGK